MVVHNVLTRFAVETKLLEFNSVMGGGGKQSTVKKYNKVGSEFFSSNKLACTHCPGVFTVKKVNFN